MTKHRQIYGTTGQLFSGLRRGLAQGCPIFAKKKEDTMLEIIVTVGLYLGALALLVKGAVTFCDYSHE